MENLTTEYSLHRTVPGLWAMMATLTTQNVKCSINIYVKFQDLVSFLKIVCNRGENKACSQVGMFMKILNFFVFNKMVSDRKIL